MHVPDGFLNLPTSVVTGVLAAGAIGVALPVARRESLGERKAPMVGMVATLIFATQMLNFPVGLGTSGHLIGGALAAVLVGPATGLLCISVVLIVQAVFFADGGLTALGTNILLMGVITVVVGWGLFRLVIAVLPARKWSVPVATGVGGLISVPVAAAAFSVLFAIGGQAPVPFEALFLAMTGWHVLIGIGEAVISALIVAAVMATRPDLVYGARFRRTRRPESEPASVAEEASA
ncbi:energy-coupling factor ABC transporter permease [Microbacterium sp. ASV49]|uniref:Energy-coupling factor ABC transporter permease n=1 Tax=Microbacterium candidum TaxID=3041922 RepID=A0ABT7MTD9_9MICO|nr:energy-coupling factor ABC transporter permease [Microbacterium sp. ASV49]MDL9977715.1 energy-coupling factor ABC transporter permease [Microbacterium sp. ASV49]